MTATSPTTLSDRPIARGKFLFAGNQKLWVRGATYGAFAPDDRQREYWNAATIDADFERMAAAGFTSVRIPHTMPPLHLLDLAAKHELRVMVGLSAEQYVGYLVDGESAHGAEKKLREAVKKCAGHPALLCYALGNEIPSSTVRWLGRRAVERYLERLYTAVKEEDPGGLVTYVNYPSTEYLQLPFLDFLSFNVYLETRERLEAYLARLQNLAGARPLLMSEIGLDAMRNGEEEQARVLDWQIRTTFEAGCCGAFVFSWTDEWYRGGAEVDDWAFGLTTRDRAPKPALFAVQRAFSEVPVPCPPDSPRVSVVVCVYNGERTIRDCCEGLREIDYPNFEVIIVDDGSTDATAAIAAEYDFRLIRTPNRGLSAARNTGMMAATGEIVAYTDGDARPDPHWLQYLVAEFARENHAGIGGWNIAPPGDGRTAECVANAPGGPVHVLLSDRIAEHIPGCSMAFRREALKAIGGFDPQFRAAGDDVDVCWRLQEQGWTLGFSHGAMVWHHFRDSIATYWKQQKGYGRAEAMLERKWPEKYNRLGHVSWSGRLYGKGLTLPIGRAGRVYHGTWGTAPFQHLAERAPSILALLPLMPEWYLVVVMLGLMSLLGITWRPLLAAAPLFALAVGVPVVQAVMAARRAHFYDARPSAQRRFQYLVVVMLHLLQPLARLYGRLRHGLTLWRQRGSAAASLPVARTWRLFVRRWRAPEERLRALQAALKASGTAVLHGGEYDAWDLEVRAGFCGSSRLLIATEDSGSGTQFIRVRSWPHCSRDLIVTLIASMVLSALAALSEAWTAAAALAAAVLIVVPRILHECSIAAHTVYEALVACGLTGEGAEDEARDVMGASAHLEAEHERV